MKPMPESPTLDGLAVIASLQKRTPAEFHSAIEHALWEAIGDFWVMGGGTYKGDSTVHVLAPFPVLYAVEPMREMGLSN